MKLTGPQARVLTLIHANPIEAQREIDTKLSTRNVVTNLIKLGAISGQGHVEEPKISMAGIWYRVTDEGYDAAGIERPNIDKLNREAPESNPVPEYKTPDAVHAEDIRQTAPYREMLKGQKTIDARRVDTVTFDPAPVVHEVVQPIRYAGSDDRAPKFPEGTPEYEAYRAELRVELDKWSRGEGEYALPMPEIDPADEPIPYVIPAQRSGQILDQMDAYALAPDLIRVPVRAPRLKYLMVGTGEVGSPTWHKNTHKATEDVKTGRIRCECGVVTKSRKLLVQLHKTTRIIPTVTEV